MRIRGERECVDCGRRWSYYETGSVACPDCGSVKSVGLDDERRLHTDTPTTLDLTSARRQIDDHPVPMVATTAEELARGYLIERGFLRGGTLRVLDDTYIAATELRHAAGGVQRLHDPNDRTLEYFLALLASADAGERPPSESVPETLRWARGLAAATIVEAYCRDVADWLDEHPDPTARSVHEALGQHANRVAALDGEVPPEEADRLVKAAQDLGDYLTGDAEGALARAEERLAQLA